jgi:hypothetical protein
MSGSLANFNATLSPLKMGGLIPCRTNAYNSTGILVVLARNSRETTHFDRSGMTKKRLMIATFRAHKRLKYPTVALFPRTEARKQRNYVDETPRRNRGRQLTGIGLCNLPERIALFIVR